jgi:hypothetical protein
MPRTGSEVPQAFGKHFSSPKHTRLNRADRDIEYLSRCLQSEALEVDENNGGAKLYRHLLEGFFDIRS